MCNVDETTLNILDKNPKNNNREMEHRRFCQFEVQREEPLLQLSDVSALVAALHALR